MRNRIVTMMVILAASLVFMGQTAEASWPWSTATPTATRFVTSTPVPSFTPTRTPHPTSTRFATSTPVPSFTPTRVVLDTPIVPISTPLARATKYAQQEEAKPTNTPFLSVTVVPSVQKHFVVTAIPPQTASVYVSCTFCTSIYYSYSVSYDMRRDYTFSGSTLSVPAGTSLYTKPVVGYGRSCTPESNTTMVQAGYNRIPNFTCE